MRVVPLVSSTSERKAGLDVLYTLLVGCKKRGFYDFAPSVEAVAAILDGITFAEEDETRATTRFLLTLFEVLLAREASVVRALAACGVSGASGASGVSGVSGVSVVSTALDASASSPPAYCLCTRLCLVLCRNGCAQKLHDRGSIGKKRDVSRRGTLLKLVRRQIVERLLLPRPRPKRTV